MTAVGFVLAAMALVAVILIPARAPTARNPGARRHWLGPVAVPEIRVLTLVGVFAGLMLSAIAIALVSFALAHWETWSSGLLYAELAAGSIAGSMAYGAWSRLALARWRVAAVLAALGIGALVLALSLAWPPAVFAATTLMGLAMGPTYTALTSTAAGAAPPHAQTETQAWINGGYGVGASLGTTLAATVHRPGLTVPLVGVLALALAAEMWRRTARPPEPALAT
jgi:MFS family permease